MSAVKAEIEKNDAIQLGVPGLGERLRSARVTRDLDIARMAERIHLTVDMVDALEHDDYSEMPARVFVRGYIRNYARTVELPIDSILAQFDALWPDEDAPVRISPSPRLASDGRPDKGWHRAMTWLLVLVMLVLFLIWWQGYLDKFIGSWDPRAPEHLSNEISRESGLQPETGSGQLPLMPPTGMDDVLPLPLSGSAQPMPQSADADPGKDEAADDGEAASGVMVTAQPSSTGLSLPDPQTSAPAAAEASPQESPVMLADTEAPSAAPPAVESLPPELTGIRVRFSQDCWVDIRDSTRTFKLIGTMKRGTEREFGGKPPYKVVLGNARGVEILVDGKSFDLESKTIANVARFTLSP